MSKIRTGVARMGYSRWAREAIATRVKVAGIQPIGARGGGGVVGGSVPTVGRGGGGGGTHSAGNQDFGVGRKVAVGISVKREGGVIRVGAVKEAVVKGAYTTKMWSKVRGRKEKHILLVHKRLLDDGRVLAAMEPPRNFFLSAR
jgi:hypothetical protein